MHQLALKNSKQQKHSQVLKHSLGFIPLLTVIAFKDVTLNLSGAISFCTASFIKCILYHFCYPSTSFLKGKLSKYLFLQRKTFLETAH